MLRGRNALQLAQRAASVAAVVEEVGQVDARLVQLRVQPQGAAQLAAGAEVVAQRVQGVAARRGELGVVRVRGRERREAHPRVGEEPLAVQRAAHGKAQLQVVRQSQVVHAGEAAERRVHLPELEERLAQPHPGVLVLLVGAQPFFERPARPRVLLAGDAHVAQPHVQERGVGVVAQPLAEDLESLVVVARLVQAVRPFVELFGAEERRSHAVFPGGGIARARRPRVGGAHGEPGVI